MPLSEIVIMVVGIVCMCGLVLLNFKTKSDCEKDSLRVKGWVSSIEQSTTKSITQLSSAVEELNTRLAQKEDILAQQQREIREWNEGVASILNYSVDVAKGDRK